MELMKKINRAITKHGGWKYFEMNSGNYKCVSTKVSVSHKGKTIHLKIELQRYVDVPLDESIGFTFKDIKQENTITVYDNQSRLSGTCFDLYQSHNLEDFNPHKITTLDEAISMITWNKEDLKKATEDRRKAYVSFHNNFLLH